MILVAAGLWLAGSTAVAEAQADAAKGARPAARDVKWNNPDSPKVPGLEHRTLSSESMGLEIGFNVWVPPAYATGDDRYPVIYFLHGMGGNENSDAGGFSGLVRQSIVDGTVPSTICVFPNGGTSGYVDHADTKVMVETFLIKELIPYVDANWRSVATRDGRVLAGFSMGGGGAMRLAVKYPDTFSAAASWAAALGSRRPGAAEALREQLQANADKIRDRVRFLMIVGEKDQTLASHEPFKEQLDELKLAYDYKLLPDVGHDLGRYHRDTGRDVVEFLCADFQKKAR